MAAGPTVDARGTRELPEDDRVAAPAAGEPAPGTMIGRFVVRGRLGGGGMGVVLAADDPDLGRRVAIKLVRAGDDRPTLRARLLREAQAMARIDHPHVVRVHEVGDHGPSLYIAMALIEGQTLTAWLTTPRPWREILAVFRQAGLGLAAIHAAGLVHRDVKPDNVLVDRDGRAHVSDLGLVRALAATSHPALDAALTHTGMVLGTPGFMAPEQQRGDAVDARADQYAFCVALRDALRGAAPPRAITAALRRGLAFDPDARFPSMGALLAALEPGRGRGRAMAAALVTAVVAGGVTIAAVAGAGAGGGDGGAGRVAAGIAGEEGGDGGALRLRPFGAPLRASGSFSPEPASEPDPEAWPGPISAPC